MKMACRARARQVAADALAELQVTANWAVYGKGGITTRETEESSKLP